MYPLVVDLRWVDLTFVLSWLLQEKVYFVIEVISKCTICFNILSQLEGILFELSIVTEVNGPDKNNQLSSVCVYILGHIWLMPGEPRQCCRCIKPWRGYMAVCTSTYSVMLLDVLFDIKIKIPTHWKLHCYFQIKPYFCRSFLLSFWLEPMCRPYQLGILICKIMTNDQLLIVYVSI